MISANTTELDLLYIRTAFTAVHTYVQASFAVRAFADLQSAKHIAAFGTF